MRYGIQIWAASFCDPRTLAKLAQLAEESGWDGIFIEDYITHWCGKETYDPWVSLAAMAMQTKHIRLGTIITPLPRRRPWKLAREAVTLDHLSNGRLILGIGLGGAEDPQNFDQLGEIANIKERAEMLNEAIDVINGLWTGKPFSYDGKHYQIEDVTFLPTPVQKPRIPIWVGGGWPGKPIERAARCDGFIPYKNPIETFESLTPEDVRAVMDYIDQHRTESTPFNMAQGGGQRGSDWEQERVKIRALAEAGVNWWIEFVEPHNLELDKLKSYIKRGPLRID
jgi:alkanesulfonate monooxygenase SsuD/methylene tetrahydromethanopterin reductase-like flavin-dependent oxidoreductase (luciferase family)